MLTNHILVNLVSVCKLFFCVGIKIRVGHFGIHSVEQPGNIPTCVNLASRLMILS